MRPVPWQAEQVVPGVAAAAVTCRAGCEVVEARVSVPAAKATVRNGDLPAMSACMVSGTAKTCCAVADRRFFS